MIFSSERAQITLLRAKIRDKYGMKETSCEYRLTERGKEGGEIKRCN
jgi:hypothetical protein